MSEYEKLADWLDAVADAHEGFNTEQSQPGDAAFVIAFYDGQSGAAATASLARFAAAALRAMAIFADEKAWKGDGIPVKASLISEQALACAEPLRERMSPQATRRGESKESSR